VPSDRDPKSPEDQPPGHDPAVPAPVEVGTDVVSATAKPESGIPADGSGSIDVALSGSIDIALSSPHLSIDGAPLESSSPVDTAPVSSGRVTSMTVAASGPTQSSRSRRLTDAAKDSFDKGVARIGTGLEHLGEGVSKLGEKSKRVPLVGSRLSEGMIHVGESLTDLPRAARSRRGRLLLRSLVVSFLLVFAWIAVIVTLQVRGTDAPDFRPDAERILTELGKGSAAIGEVYEQASPRFQEMVRKERFIDVMTDLNATVGTFTEITAVNESLVTSGPSGRIGRVSLGVAYKKGKTNASVSLHWDQGKWKLLGIGVEVPPELKVTQAEREERVAACKDPMDSRRCDVHVAANHILEQLRDGRAEAVWDEASKVFQKQEEKSRFRQIQAEHQIVLGEYRRIIAVTEAKVIGGTSVTYDVLVEYAKANVRAIFGFQRTAQTEPWALRSLKVVLPMPRLDDLPRAGSGSGSGSGAHGKSSRR